jgi:primase-polymerase (primpol)-like protein
MCRRTRLPDACSAGTRTVGGGGHRALSRSTWGRFDDAVDAYEALLHWSTPVDGIGVVLTRASDISCIDLDNVIAADGELDARAAKIVERCASWTERSPSGRGLHVFVRGLVPRALRGDRIEVYSAVSESRQAIPMAPPRATTRH